MGKRHHASLTVLSAFRWFDRWVNMFFKSAIWRYRRPILKAILRLAEFLFDHYGT